MPQPETLTPSPMIAASTGADWKTLAREAAPVVWWVVQILLMLYALQHVTLEGAATIVGVWLIWHHVSTRIAAS